MANISRVVLPLSRRKPPTSLLAINTQPRRLASSDVPELGRGLKTGQAETAASSVKGDGDAKDYTLPENKIEETDTFLSSVCSIFSSGSLSGGKATTTDLVTTNQAEVTQRRSLATFRVPFVQSVFNRGRRMPKPAAKAEPLRGSSARLWQASDIICSLGRGGGSSVLGLSNTLLSGRNQPANMLNVVRTYAIASKKGGGLDKGEKKEQECDKLKTLPCLTTTQASGHGKPAGSTTTKAVCSKICMPCCKNARDPPICFYPFKKPPCNKLHAPRPSYSECKKLFEFRQVVPCECLKPTVTHCNKDTGKKGH